MKTYKLKLLTQSGVIDIIYHDSKPIEELEKEVLIKHGQFTTLSAIEII